MIGHSNRSKEVWLRQALALGLIFALADVVCRNVNMCVRAVLTLGAQTAAMEFTRDALVVFAVSASSVMRLAVLEMKLLSFSNLDTPIDIWSSSRCNFSTVTAMPDVLQRRNCCKTLVHLYRELILGFFHLIVLHAQLIQLRGTHVALELSVLLDRSLDAQLLFPLFVCARQSQQ
jgi:hypothetical protein